MPSAPGNRNASEDPRNLQQQDRPGAGREQPGRCAEDAEQRLDETQEIAETSDLQQGQPELARDRQPPTNAKPGTRHAPECDIGEVDSDC